MFVTKSLLFGLKRGYTLKSHLVFMIILFRINKNFHQDIDTFFSKCSKKTLNVTAFYHKFQVDFEL